AEAVYQPRDHVQRIYSVTPPGPCLHATGAPGRDQRRQKHFRNCLGIGLPGRELLPSRISTSFWLLTRRASRAKRQVNISQSSSESTRFDYGPFNRRRPLGFRRGTWMLPDLWPPGGWTF